VNGSFGGKSKSRDGWNVESGVKLLPITKQRIALLLSEQV